MYIAELKGKLSSREDILTSNVFSFFKYSKRKQYLKPFLNELGFNITEKEANEAEFIFWPTYDDGTEPDIVLIFGSYYILFEAKLSSDFGKKQLVREANGGKLEAKRIYKQFYLIALTADYSEPKEKFNYIRKEVNFIWINWHRIAVFLEKRLQENIADRQFAEDLYALLIKKNLRIFDGYFDLFHKNKIVECKFAFFDFISAKYRGSFIGFLGSFAYWLNNIKKHKVLFYDRSRELSWSCPRVNLAKANEKIFFGG